MKKLLIILLPITIFSQSTQTDIDSLRYYMHNELNVYRISMNLDTLEICDDINKKAQYWAEQMYKNKNFKHSTIYPDGENIFMGINQRMNYKDQAIDILNEWKISPGHNRNILYPKNIKIGYGFYKGYAVQMFKHAKIIYTGI